MAQANALTWMTGARFNASDFVITASAACYWCREMVRPDAMHAIQNVMIRPFYHSNGENICERERNGQVDLNVCCHCTNLFLQGKWLKVSCAIHQIIDGILIE